ncbi:Rrp5p KNAG_0J02180 [Huiozyma naganishii CBS 8797]|uniref:mRNA 3'-end-processing protein RNA14 n=1 Tax=Huiozyma naganishii (strain ATCC MYA-139 / BCRC 22969 / CBS 8797 / KCTC 17520 / NBRC 10181 / NCYC 3082 / Yp74L-3) TaxID=1071383 RepID=J7S9U1_HUIN7|nr:hypothetical protein KNAG_0J02180 [Kazachstania naganishii CBS 8797]CCK72299.1 hypothetical protein KNAG_0J02180 [Kazachstania naganishii CBS 8797]
MSSGSKRKRSEESPLTREDGTIQPSNSALVSTTEEISFPRGGASALSPLELKQVANEAASDVLFGNNKTSTEVSRPKKKKKTSIKDKDAAGELNEDAALEDEKLSVVHHISFRSLKVGSSLIGQVSEINKNDICVTFSDGISGFVNLTHISEQFTHILEELDENMDSDEEKESEYESDNEKAAEAKELPDLKNYFKLGQWLRCNVLTNNALTTKSKNNKKRRIELTIEPSYVNTFTEEDLVKSAPVQCSVKSVEDHGATLDVGVVGITGFISKKDIGSSLGLLPGAVFLGNVYKQTERVVNINLDFSSKKNKITQISNVDALVPGMSLDLLCKAITPSGIVGKCFGLVNGFISSAHLGVFKEDDMKHKFAIGSNIQCRVLATLINNESEKVALLSLIPNIERLEPTLKCTEAFEAFPIGYNFETTKVKGRDSEYLYLAVDDDRVGRVHKSRIGELDSTDNLKAKVMGYDIVDNMYELATDPKILALKYVRSKDIKIGELLTTCIVNAVSEKGIELKIFNGQFVATVSPLHISDTRLVYPERKFKIGGKVKARILNVDNRGRIYATMKKSLVNLEQDETPIISSYEIAKTAKEKNEKTLATVEVFRKTGCIVSFFGGVRGFLPNAEISEVFVKKPEQHLRLGQTVVVRLLKVDAEDSRILATCKVSNAQAQEQKETIEQLVPGRSMINVTVVEKTKDALIIEMDKVELRGVLQVGHLSDSRIEQNRADFKKIAIGTHLRGLVIDKETRTQVFNMTLKKSLIEAAEKEELPTSYSDIKAVSKDTPLCGYVKSISDKGLFIAFNGKFVGLVLPSYAVESRDVDISKTFFINQSVSAYLLRSDDENERFLLTLKAPKIESKKKEPASDEVTNPIDNSIKKLSDYTIGKIVKGTIKAVKKNQLNIILADDLHGRIDVSEVYDNYSDILNTKAPLSQFKNGSIIEAKIVGNHDIKSHKFLPITHQIKKGTVLELSIKPSVLSSEDNRPLSLKDISIGDELVGFVNNYSLNFLWLTISPILKAKLSMFDLTEDGLELSKNIEDNFPLGSAIPVKVTAIDSTHEFATVTGRSHVVKDFDSIAVNDVIPARIGKIFENFLLLDLGNSITGLVFATDALDSFSTSLNEAYGDKVNRIVSAKVVAIDKKNKKINLSLRSEASKVPTVTSYSDLKQGDIVHGLVKTVNDKGIFVYLSRTVEAFVPISKLSDAYLKDWKKFYKPMQHVIGKVVKSEDDKHILITLRESEVNGDLKVLKNYDDIKVGEVFKGSVKNITDFGVFIKLDNTANVTGLAHISEIADSTPNDISSLFGPGDKVKAIVLKTNSAKKQLSLSLKASHFTKEETDEEKDEDQIATVNFDDADSEVDVDSDIENEPEKMKLTSMSTDGLSLSSGFDWTTSILDQARESESESEDEEDNFMESKKHKHKRRDRIVQDKTIDINTRAPESVGDFERLIMGNPNSSVVWMNYIAFQLQLSEVEKAREIAERALKTINFREETEKLNIWIAMLNLENTFGTPDTLDDIFKRACQYMDSYTMHNKLLSIYQMSDKTEAAATLFKATAKKFGSEKVSIWIAWSEFLLANGEEDGARNILSNALKALPKRHHVEVVRRFAQLEFSKGDSERGRSLFEGLLADAPKRIDIWNVYIDQESKAGDKQKVDALYERVFSRKITKKQAKFFFNKWLQFEETAGDEKMIDYVKAKASEYVDSHFTNKKE